MRRTLKTLVAAAALLLPAGMAAAFERITDGAEFRQLVSGRELTRFGISLQVTPQGQVLGDGLGWPVTGEWRWQNGLFCRTLDWGGSDLGYNCQTVLRNGDRLRFIADEGTGQSADFRLR